MTLSQAFNLIGDGDPDAPPREGVEIRNAEDWDTLIKRLQEE